MNGLATLPLLPESATDGLPAPTELFTAGQRRRYAYTLACALVGEPSWTIVVHPGWKLPRQEVERIMQSGWPAIGNTRAVAVIQPGPMPEDPTELFRRAVAVAGEGRSEGVAKVLWVLWAGEWPTGVEAEIEVYLGEAIFQAGLRAAEAAEAAAEESVAA